MKELLILDLFCKAGGCSVGYANALQKLNIPFRIIGVDIKDQKNYPFEFVKADALEYAIENGHRFDFIHASPPCQFYSRSTAFQKSLGKVYPDMVPDVRRILSDINKSAVIENVSKSAVRPDLTLRGDIFRLKVIRVRHFETINVMLMQPGFPKLKGTVKNGDFVCVYGKASWQKSGHAKNRDYKIPDWRKETILKTWQYAMGIDWMNADEIREAIPPAYTEYIGDQIFPGLYKKMNTKDNRPCVVASRTDVDVRFTTGNVGVTRRLIRNRQIKEPVPVTENQLISLSGNVIEPAGRKTIH